MIEVKRVLRSDQQEDVLTRKPNSVLIDTCKRQELYWGSGSISRDNLNHLFRLVSGLESPLLGENAIQGQVKQGYLEALPMGLSKELHRLFQRALSVGKRVRTETAITRGAVSYEQAAVDLLINQGIDLSRSRITLIGAHRMNENLLRHLTRKDAGTLLIANRTYDKALELARKYDCIALRFDQLKGAMNQTDILISATKSPHYLITPHSIPQGKAMVLVDLAAPRDVDPRLKNWDTVELIDLHDIESHVEQNLKERQLECKKAEGIIAKEVNLYLKEKMVL